MRPAATKLSSRAVRMLGATPRLRWKSPKRAVRRAIKNEARYHLRTGKRVPERQFKLAMRRSRQALLGAFQIRRGAQVTTTTVTFSAIGQPQHITAPPHALSDREFVRLTRHH